MKKNVFVLAVTLMLVLAAILPALADGTITLTGQPRSIAPQNFTFVGVTLGGADQLDRLGSTTGWIATDPTGTGDGWKVTIAADAPTNVGGKTIPLSGFEITLLDTNINVTGGDGLGTNTKPLSAADSSVLTLGSAQTLVSANANLGMGTYVMTPTLSLDIPAATYAGIYTTTLTVTIAAIP